MAKKKEQKAAEDAAAKLAEQKKNDLTLGAVDNSAINAAAPTGVQSSIAITPNPIAGAIAKKNADLQTAADARAKERLGDAYIAPVNNSAMANALANANKVQSITPKPKEGIIVNGVTKTPEDMIVSKPKTIQDYFNEYKQAAIKDKTDAQKMQQYYALTDVLKTLGQMGGGIVGGAIGGSITDNMPNVGEYKASQNYINAFENAKKAKDRLRELDNQQFQLALNMDERTWKQQQAALDREYRMQEKALDNQWQMTFFDYKTKIEQAIADKDFARKAQLQKELQAAKQAHELEKTKLSGDYSLKARRISADSGRDSSPKTKTRTIDFIDDSKITVSEDDYQRIQDYFIGGTYGSEDEEITNKNIKKFIRENPDMIKEFLGLETNTTNETTQTWTPPQRDYILTSPNPFEGEDADLSRWLDLD